MALKKFTKDDISDILKRLLKQKNFDDVQTEINDIADEYNIDITEPDELDEEKEPTMEDLEDFSETTEADWDDEY